MKTLIALFSIVFLLNLTPLMAGTNIVCSLKLGGIGGGLITSSDGSSETNASVIFRLTGCDKSKYDDQLIVLSQKQAELGIHILAMALEEDSKIGANINEPVGREARYTVQEFHIITE